MYEISDHGMLLDPGNESILHVAAEELFGKDVVVDITDWCIELRFTNIDTELFAKLKYPNIVGQFCDVINLRVMCEIVIDPLSPSFCSRRLIKCYYMPSNIAVLQNVQHHDQTLY